MSHGLLHNEKRLIEITKFKGSYWDKIGFYCQNKFFIFYEEGIYLLYKNNLVLLNDKDILENFLRENFFTAFIYLILKNIGYVVRKDIPVIVKVNNRLSTIFKYNTININHQLSNLSFQSEDTFGLPDLIHNIRDCFNLNENYSIYLPFKWENNNNILPNFVIGNTENWKIYKSFTIDDNKNVLKRYKKAKNYAFKFNLYINSFFYGHFNNVLPKTAFSIYKSTSKFKKSKIKNPNFSIVLNQSNNLNNSTLSFPTTDIINRFANIACKNKLSTIITYYDDTFIPTPCDNFVLNNIHSEIMKFQPEFLQFTNF